MTVDQRLCLLVAFPYVSSDVLAHLRKEEQEVESMSLPFFRSVFVVLCCMLGGGAGCGCWETTHFAQEQRSRIASITARRRRRRAETRRRASLPYLGEE